jgi:DNA invertase Pin-like site-specific DNA recombinase
VSVTDGIDSSTAAGRSMIGVLGSLAEYERELIKERTALKRMASRAGAAERPRYSAERILVRQLCSFTSMLYAVELRGQGVREHTQTSPKGVHELGQP